VAYEHILFERRDRIAIIMINRPERANSGHSPPLSAQREPEPAEGAEDDDSLCALCAFCVESLAASPR
jgi:hypothetical protein